MLIRIALLMVGPLLLLQGCTYNTVTGQSQLKSSQDDTWDAQYAKGLEAKYKDFQTYLANNYEHPDAATLNGQPLANHRQAVRDQVVTELLWLSDYYYKRDVNALYNDDNAINFVTDVINLGLTSAATIAGGTQTKTVLSGIATFATGARSSYDADYLHKQTITAIINDMDKLRSTAEQAIYQKLQPPNNTDAQYPLEPAALKDLANLQFIGVLAAVEDLQNNTKTAATAQQGNTALTRNLYFATKK